MINFKELKGYDLSSTYWNTLPDSHLSYLYQNEGIDNNEATFEDSVKMDLLYPYMMFYQIYSESNSFVVENNYRPYDVTFFLGDGYIVESNLNRHSIFISTLTNRKADYYIEKFENEKEDIHRFFDLLDWLETYDDEDSEEIDFINAYVKSFPKEKQKTVKKLIKKYPPNIQIKKRNVNRKLNQGT